MDRDSYPRVKRAWKLRLFGTNPVTDETVIEFAYKWMSLEIDALEKQSKVLEPMIELWRKLIFKHDQYRDEVTVRGKKFELEWESWDDFKDVMDEIVTHLLGKEVRYYKKDASFFN